MVLIDIELPERGPERVEHIHYLIDDERLYGGDYAQCRLECAAGRRVGPLHSLDAVRVHFHEPGSVRAGHPVNLDAVGPGHESEYVITEYWIAAFGHLVVKPFQVLCVDYENIVGRFSAYPFVAWFALA